MDLVETILVYVYLAVFLLLGGFFRWLGREGLTQFFTAKLKLDFDTQLTKIQSDFRQVEARLIADLQQKTQELASLRDGALSNSRLRSQAGYERRIAALDGIWNTLIELKKFDRAATLNSMIDFDAQVVTIKGDAAQAAAFKEMTKDLTLESFDSIPNGDQFRLHVSDSVWNLFSSYRAVVHGAIVVLAAVRIGQSPRVMFESSTLDLMIKAVLPELEKLGVVVNLENAHLILPPLEVRILETIKKELRGEDFSSSEIEEAARINETIQKVISRVSGP